MMREEARRQAAAAAPTVAASTVASQAAGAAQSTAASRDDTSSHTGGADAASGIPAWATDQHDIRVWFDMLSEAGVDQTAMQDLFLLAQHSEVGRQQALGIVMRVIKKRSDGAAWHNVSGFVHKCAIQVWHSLPNVWVGGGEGRWDSSDDRWQSNNRWNSDDRWQSWQSYNRRWHYDDDDEEWRDWGSSGSWWGRRY